jgi:hypothetical protein
MKEDSETLAELMLHADQFCSKSEAAMKDVAPNPEQEELRTKLGQCRAQLAHLQNVFDEDKLNIENAAVRADFRHYGADVGCLLCAHGNRLQTLSETRYD